MRTVFITKMIVSHNDKFAIKIEHHHFITKDKAKATSFVGIDNSADAKVKIVKELKDPNVTHKYSTKSCVAEIGARLNRLGVTLKYGEETKRFNTYHFNLFCKYYGIKENPKFCYQHQLTHTYGYSIQTIDFIVEEIKKDPDNIIQNLREYLAK